jgi:hypothetical protein
MENTKMCSLQETHLTDKNKHCLRVKGCKTYQANGPGKQVGVAILISDKVVFKPKLVRRDKEGHFILTKGAIPLKEITITNFNNPLSPIHRSSR